MVDRRIDESVMAGRGEYSEHSRPQHAAASVAYPYLRRAAEDVPLPDDTTPLQILDMGCAGGRNEMEPMALAIDGLRGRGAANAVEIVHTDLPENDFGPLFELLDGPDGYTAGRDRLFPSVVGRTHFGPLVADARAHLAWTGITLHWLSTMPCVVPDAVFANLTTGDAREALKHQAARDWEVFLRERARELIDGGQLVIVAGASDDEDRSDAERDAIKAAFYRGLQQRIEAAPDVAVCDWRVVSLRLRRRPRTRG